MIRSTTAGSMSGQSEDLEIASQSVVRAAAMCRSSRSVGWPRTEATPACLASSTTGSSEAAVVVATMICAGVRAACSRSSMRTSSGFPASGNSTFPGSRVEPVRA
jgi:hypothetical protein